MSAIVAGAAYDTLAERYDAMWSDTAIGRQQRAAVWRWVDPLFQPGQRILDLGCGTGVDAAHFLARGIEVTAIDASAAMVRIARSRGIDARQLAAENLTQLSGDFDGAISDFGALNFVSNLKPVAAELRRRIRHRGRVAICVAGRFCAWETIYYLLRLRPGKAFRRWNPRGAASSFGVRVHYPSVRRLAAWFAPAFRLAGWRGIGLCVPPSYVSGISDQMIERLASADRQLAHMPGLRALADHRLLIFERI